jgi:hypothetical protein
VTATSAILLAKSLEEPPMKASDRHSPKKGSTKKTEEKKPDGRVTRSRSISASTKTKKKTKGIVGKHFTGTEHHKSGSAKKAHTLVGDHMKETFGQIENTIKTKKEEKVEEMKVEKKEEKKGTKRKASDDGPPPKRAKHGSQAGFTGQLLAKNNQLEGCPKFIKDEAMNCYQNQIGQYPLTTTYFKNKKDEYGRIECACGRIIGGVKDRGKQTYPDPDEKGGFDDAGHLVPENAVNDEMVTRYVNTRNNIVAENQTINQHYKKGFEDSIKVFAAQHKEWICSTLHVPLYEGESKRPKSIQHYFAIEGIPVAAITLDNPKEYIETKTIK